MSVREIRDVGGGNAGTMHRQASFQRRDCQSRDREGAVNGRGGVYLRARLCTIAPHVAALVFFAAAARAEVRVMTTSPSLADIVRQIGGPHVSAEAVMRGPENVHNVAAKPSDMVKLKKADLWVHSGLDAEIWAPTLVKGARNAKLLPGQAGDVDVSRGIQLKEVPGAGGLTRALGDIHVYGNTHYALDPLNGVIIARTITDALKRTDAAHAAEFEKNYEAYAKRLRDLTERLLEKLKPYHGATVATYHRQWPYFLDRFGLTTVAEVEPKPGISPGPQHLADCVAQMQARGAKVVIVETYNSKENAEFVAQKAGGRAVAMCQEVNAVAGVDTYEKMFEFNIDALVAAFKKTGGAAGGTMTPASGDTGSQNGRP